MEDSRVVLDSTAEAKLASLRTDAELLITKAKEIATIASPEQESRAVEFLSQIKLRLKLAEENRTFIVKPFNDQVKAINSRFKETTEPLEQADATVRKGMIAWRNSENVRIAKENADRLAVEAKQALREGDTTKMMEKVQESQEARAGAPAIVRTQTGKSSFRKETRWEIEDLTKIPAEYWSIDEKKIAADSKRGVAIPGVKTWTEEVPVIS